MKNFEVRSIEHRIAKPFIVAHHYSQNCPTGLNIFFGAYIGDDLYAVADYGMGANMDKGASLARATGLPVRYQTVTQEWLDTPHKNMNIEGLTVGGVNCLELKRLCRKGAKTDKSQIPLTRFLAICHRMLKKDGINYIVSYSDQGELRTEKIDGKYRIKVPEASGPKQTCGGIYRAANFKHLGQTLPEAHTVDASGKVFHRRVAYKEMKRWNDKNPDALKTLAEVRRERGTVPILTPPKERWFIELR